MLIQITSVQQTVRTKSFNHHIRRNIWYFCLGEKKRSFKWISFSNSYLMSRLFRLRTNILRKWTHSHLMSNSVCNFSILVCQIINQYVKHLTADSFYHFSYKINYHLRFVNSYLDTHIQSEMCMCMCMLKHEIFVKTKKKKITKIMLKSGRNTESISWRQETRFHISSGMRVFVFRFLFFTISWHFTN